MASQSFSLWVCATRHSLVLWVACYSYLTRSVALCGSSALRFREFTGVPLTQMSCCNTDRQHHSTVDYKDIVPLLIKTLAKTWQEKYVLRDIHSTNTIILQKHYATWFLLPSTVLSWLLLLSFTMEVGMIHQVLKITPIDNKKLIMSVSTSWLTV